MYHVGEEHQVVTMAGTPVARFHGQVPRVGDVLVTNDHRRWRVVEVRWYVDEWYKDPLRQRKGMVYLSQARLMVEGAG